MIKQSMNELEAIREDIAKKMERLQVIEKEIKSQEKDLKIVAESIEKNLAGYVHKDEFTKFFQKPYVIIPQRQNKILVVVPKFIKGFQVGWLWKETESFYVYNLDQYSAWLGDVPRELLEEINFKKEIEADIRDNQIFFEPSQQEIIKKKLGQHIKDITETSARIVRGHEFDLIAEMIENGNLPFKPKKVANEDLREEKGKITLYNYQKPAFAKFFETGALGLFYPTGSGKSIIACKIIDTIKGKKLIVVPTRTLIEMWNWYIETYIPHAKEEIKIITYQGYRASEEEFVLTIFDECQKLPADTFSRLALIKTKYRVGLSASPHREDGRESYIFALTGFPMGLNWQEYMETTGRKYHPIYVHIVRGSSGKEKKVFELLNRNDKTFIFCDTIELGKRIANSLDVPFIFGETGQRLDLIKENKVLVVSRVMDLGVSIKDLKHIIEVDFLFGSRQQELQRTGRLMHSLEKNVRHDIIFTEKEIEQYGKRIWSLQEKGFTIKVES